MGFRGRIWLHGALFGVFVAVAAFALLAGVDVVVASQTAGRVVVGVGVVLAAVALMVVLGIGQFDDEIASRAWWALSLLTEAAFLVVLGLGVQRTPPGDLEARLSFSTWSIVMFLALALLGLLEGWAERRAAPMVRAPFYRRRPEAASDDPYRFVGDRR